MEDLTQEQMLYVAAQVERTQLREQAWREHKSNLECEERRYQAELKNIERRFRRQTGAEDAPESAAVTRCRYCGRPLMQAGPDRWTTPTGRMHCPGSALMRHSPA